MLDYKKKVVCKGFAFSILPKTTLCCGNWIEIKFRPNCIIVAKFTTGHGIANTY